MTSLNDKVCLVTGASSGIGEATARLLAKDGASVVLAARRKERLDEIAGEIGGLGGRAVAAPCDVTRLKDLEDLRTEVERVFGRLDVLVNNAGIPGGGWFAKLEIDQIDRVTATNYVSVLHTTKLFLPMLLESGGHVVNVASLAGRYALPGAAVYSASKHAVVAFSESLYHELRPKGVMVTVVNPGLVETEGFPHADIKGDARLAPFVMPPERIARVVLEVIRKRKGPEVSVPRWLGPLQAVRVLTPPLYRQVLRRIVGGRSTEAKAP